MIEMVKKKVFFVGHRVSNEAVTSVSYPIAKVNSH